MIDFRKYPREFIVDFIGLYKSLPSTWKIKSKEYSNRENKANDYNLLIEKLREVEPNADRELVVKRINSMRSVYRRELKKYKQLKSGMGTDEVATPSLWYFDLLHFLKDQELPRQSTSTIEINDSFELNTSNDSISTETSAMTEVSQPLMPPPSPAPSPSIFQSPTPSSVPLSSTPLPGPSTSSSIPSSSSSSVIEPTPKNLDRRAVKRVCSKIDAVLAKIAKELERPAPELDRFDHLSLSWAGTLKNLVKEQAIYAEKLINDVLFEAQLNNLSRDSFIQVDNYSQQSTHFYPSVHHHQQPYSQTYPEQYQQQYQQPSAHQQSYQHTSAHPAQYQQLPAHQQSNQQPSTHQEEFQQPSTHQEQFQQSSAHQEQFQQPSAHQQQYQPPLMDVDDNNGINEPDNIVNLINNFKE